MRNEDLLYYEQHAQDEREFMERNFCHVVNMY